MSEMKEPELQIFCIFGFKLSQANKPERRSHTAATKQVLCCDVLAYDWFSNVLIHVVMRAECWNFNSNKPKMYYKIEIAALK